MSTTRVTIPVSTYTEDDLGILPGWSREGPVQTPIRLEGDLGTISSTLTQCPDEVSDGNPNSDHPGESWLRLSVQKRTKVPTRSDINLGSLRTDLGSVSRRSLRYQSWFQLSGPRPRCLILTTRGLNVLTKRRYHLIPTTTQCPDEILDGSPSSNQPNDGPRTCPYRIPRRVSWQGLLRPRFWYVSTPTKVRRRPWYNLLESSPRDGRVLPRGVRTRTDPKVLENDPRVSRVFLWKYVPADGLTTNSSLYTWPL